MRPLSRAAATSAAAAPVLAPKRPSGSRPQPQISIDPIDGLREALREQRDVENVGSVGLFLLGQQIEEQGCDGASVERVGDRPVARAEAARSAAVNEDDQGARADGNVQRSRKVERGDAHLARRRRASSGESLAPTDGKNVHASDPFRATHHGFRSKLLGQDLDSPRGRRRLARAAPIALIYNITNKVVSGLLDRHQSAVRYRACLSQAGSAKAATFGGDARFRSRSGNLSSAVARIARCPSARRTGSPGRTGSRGARGSCRCASVSTPFGDDRQAEALGQGHDGLRDGSVVGAVGQVADERLVDLELVQRQLLEVGQATNSRCRSRPWRSRRRAA